MFRKVLVSVCAGLVLVAVNCAEAEVFSFKLDLGLEGHLVPEGFCEISGGPGSSPEPWIVNNVCGSGIDVTLETTWPAGNTLGFRDNGFHELFGDCIFVDNHPESGIVVTIGNLAPGSYSFTGYHNDIWGTWGAVFDVYVNDIVVVEGLQGSGVAAGGDFNDVSTSNLIFTISEGQDSVEFKFLPPEPNYIVLNGLIIEEYEAGAAKDPSPADTAEHIEPDVVLNWTPGDSAALHHVYFGTDFNDVNEADTSSAEYKGAQALEANSYDPTSGGGYLDLGVTHYWRIDEVNDVNKWTGQVWSFTVKGGKAYNPVPADGVWTVSVYTVLMWSAGALATSHDVYFGSDPCALPLVSPGQTGTFYLPGSLESGQTYYWRIDEHGPLGDFAGDIWSFTTEGGMILHYKFDETDGNTAADASGHALDGEVHDPHWEYEGQFDGCLGFDYDTYVSSPQELFSNIGREISAAVWVNGEGGDGGNYLFTVHFGVDEFTRAIGACVPRGDAPWAQPVEFIAGKAPEDFVQWWDSEAEDWQGEWNHYAFVKDEIAQTVRIHHNGVRVAEKIGGTLDTLNLFEGRGVFIGRGWRQFHDHYEGRLDDFRIYDYALSDLEIARLFRGGDLALAWNPRPRDGATGVEQEAAISWQPGDYATRHDVYFGSSWDDVNDATTSSAVYVGRQYPCDYNVPEVLGLETTYFWRIDEVNDSNGYVWKGRVWSFTTTNFVVVDDMESYDSVVAGGNEIYDTWDDGFGNGTGSQLALEYDANAIVHGGVQAMRFGYNNAIAYYKYSEIDANTTGPRPGNLEIGMDWTVFGVRTLTLFFYGKAGNDADEQMYAALEDGSRNTAISEYGDMGEDMNDIKVAEWHQWDMPLTAFSDGGVTLEDVNKVRIGFGDRVNPAVGGAGQVYFDDIRLYLPKCVPWIRKPASDFSNNCIVDLADVGIMAEDWLRTDRQFDTVQEPDYGKRIGYWTLDSTANDSSGNNHHGVPEGTYGWVAGRVGSGAVAFGGDGGRVRVADAAQLRPQTAVSAMAWVKYSVDQGHSARVVVKGADNVETFGLEVDGDDDLVFYVRDANGNRFEVSAGIRRGEWLHLAGTFDGDTNTVSCYVNAELMDSRDDAGFLDLGLTLSQDTNDLAIGNRSDANDREFIGTIDDVQVYSYALSQPEIAYAATENLASGVGYLPLETETNLYNEEAQGERAINLRDYAVLMESWLEKLYWP